MLFQRLLSKYIHATGVYASILTLLFLCQSLTNQSRAESASSRLFKQWAWRVEVTDFLLSTETKKVALHATRKLWNQSVRKEKVSPGWGAVKKINKCKVHNFSLYLGHNSPVHSASSRAPTVNFAFDLYPHHLTVNAVSYEFFCGW